MHYLSRNTFRLPHPVCSPFVPTEDTSLYFMKRLSNFPKQHRNFSRGQETKTPNLSNKLGLTTSDKQNRFKCDIKTYNNTTKPILHTCWPLLITTQILCAYCFAYKPRLKNKHSNSYILNMIVTSRTQCPSNVISQSAALFLIQPFSLRHSG